MTSPRNTLGYIRPCSLNRGAGPGWLTETTALGPGISYPVESHPRVQSTCIPNVSLLLAQAWRSARLRVPSLGLRGDTP